MELKCDRCSYTACFPMNLERHRKMPVKGPVHQCSLCDFTGCFKNTMNNHMKENHGSGPRRYNCDWCSYSTDVQSSLSVHARQRRTHPVLECSVPSCDYKSCFNSGMWRHKRLCHGIYDKGETVLKYPDGFSHESTSNQNMEIQPRVESSIEEFKGCEMKLRNDQGKSMKLASQEYSVATLVPSKKEKKIYRCSRCNYSTTSRLSLSVHARQRRTHPVLECPVPECNFKSCFRIGIFLHKNRFHEMSNKRKNFRKQPDVLNPELSSNRYPEIGATINSSVEKLEAKSETKLGNDQANSSKFFIVESSVGILGQDKQAKIYRCDHCSYSTNLRANLDVHTRQRKGHPVQECPVTKCNYKSCFRKGITIHKRQFHGILNKPKIFFKHPDSTSNQNPHIHTATNSSNEKLEARSETKLETDQVNRIKFVNMGSSIGLLGQDKQEKTYRCDLCSFSANLAMNLSVHVSQRRTHPVLECLVPKCNYKSCFRRGMLKHERQVHGNSAKCEQNLLYSKLNRQVYRCDSCSYATGSSGNLAIHVKQRRGEPVLECSAPKCAYKSCFKLSMIRHEKKTHGILTQLDQIHLKSKLHEYQYRCESCSYSTNLVRSLEIHIRQRRGKPVLECSVPECNYKSCFKLGMIRHEKNCHGICKNLGTYLYTRDFFNPESASDNSSDIKPGCDSIAGRFEGNEETGLKNRYARSMKLFNLKSSIVIWDQDNQQKQYRCDRCSYSTNSLANLSTHARQRRTRPILECSVPNCNYKSCFNSGMWRHKRQYHGIHNKKEIVPLFPDGFNEESTSNQNPDVGSAFDPSTEKFNSTGKTKLENKPVKSMNSLNCESSLGILGQSKPEQTYRCERCSYSTNVPWSLSVHAGIRRTHPVLECSVPKCDYKSCFNSGMWRHKRQYHGIHKKNETLSLFADGINEESTSIQNLYLGPEFDPSTEKFNSTGKTKLENKLVKSMNSFNCESSIGIFGEIKPEQTYRCERCSYSTNSLANLSTHARQRRTRPVLECSVPNCNYKSCFNSGMWRHKRQYHGIHKKNETVPSLPDGFNEESTSNQTPNLRPTFDPSTEKFNATGKTKLENIPVKSMNLFSCESSIEIFGQDKKEKTYRCESCSYSTNFRPNLEMHARQRRSHPVLECSVPKCSFKACFRASMVRHSKQSHEMFNKPKIVPQISHSLCPKTEEKLVDFSNPDCSLNTLNDEKIYKCDRCSFSTTFRGSISIHLRRRVNQPVSMCSEPGCSYKSCFKLSMVKHKNMNHPLRKTLRIKNKGFTSNNSKIKKLSCPFCNYMCNLRSTLNVHVKQHRAFSKNTKLNQSLISCGKENKYSCGRCSFSTANPRNMFVHKKCQTKYPVLKCSYPKCQYTSCFRIGLTKHTIRVHGGDCKEDVPNHGFFKLTSSSALSLQKSRLQLTKQQDPTKEFKCDRCSYSTNRHGDLYTHFRNRGNQPILNCPVQGCSYKSCFKLGLGRHRNRAHGMGSLPTNPACVTSSVQRHAFSCPFCNYTCRLKSVLSIHLSRHRTIAGQKKLTRTPTTETHALFRSDATAIKDEQRIYFSCPYCDYSSDCRVEVGNHVKAHRREDIIFSCQFCNFQANYLGVIEKHEKRHSKERSLGCELCGKVFAVHENLRRHELLHRNKSFLRGKGLKLKKFG